MTLDESGEYIEGHLDLPTTPWTPGYATAALASYSAGEGDPEIRTV